VKSAVENLDPTRVRLTVEVPYEELKPSLDAAYKKIASQVTVPGFRRGKVPPAIIDQRFGREAVLEEAVNDALPKMYGQAIEENKLDVVGRPEVEVKEAAPGTDLKFTVEVDVRPEITLPDYQGIAVTVDNVEVSDEQVDERMDALRRRFATLTTVERAAAKGDHVVINLVASIDGVSLDDGTATDLDYEVGSGTMVEGLDEAVTGLSAGESANFSAKLVGGSHAGDEAEVSVTVTAVKEAELPDLDDEFAQLASEFDTFDELRADARENLLRLRRMEQVGQARDKVLEALLERVDIPLPASVVDAERQWRDEALAQQLSQSGMSRDGFLKVQGKTAEEFDAEVDEQVRNGVKAQFVLDKLADAEQLSVNQQELTEHLIRRAAGSGMSPDQFAQQVVQGGQVPALVGEVRRGKALELVLAAATVTDESGEPVDLKAGEDPSVANAMAAAVAAAEAAEAAGDDTAAAAGDAETDETADTTEAAEQA
jgi:trigger factor